MFLFELIISSRSLLLLLSLSSFGLLALCLGLSDEVVSCVEATSGLSLPLGEPSGSPGAGLLGSDDLTTGLEQLCASLHVGSVLEPHVTLDVLAERVVSDAQGALVGECAGDFTLELGLGRPDNARIVDQTVLGRVFLRLQGPEESFLRTQNLDG